MVEYGKLLGKSWKDLTNNPIIFLPVLIGILLSILVIGLIAIEALIILAVSGITFPLDSIDALSGFGTSAIIFAVIFGLIDIIIMFVIRAYINSMIIGMANEIVKKGITNSKNMFKYGRILFETVLKLILVELGLIILPVAVMALILFLLLQVSMIALGIFAVLFVLLLIVYMIFLALGLFFVEPVIANYKAGIIDLVRFSFNYAKENLGHTVITFLIVLVINIVVGIIFYVLNMMITLFFAGLTAAGLLVAGIALIIIFALIRFVINLIVTYYLYLFRFNCFEK